MSSAGMALICAPHRLRLYRHMLALADSFEGWAQTKHPDVTPERSAELLGMAEAFRVLAEAGRAYINPVIRIGITPAAFEAIRRNHAGWFRWLRGGSERGQRAPDLARTRLVVARLADMRGDGRELSAT